MIRYDDEVQGLPPSSGEAPAGQPAHHPANSSFFLRFFSSWNTRMRAFLTLKVSRAGGAHQAGRAGQGSTNQPGFLREPAGPEQARVQP